MHKRKTHQCWVDVRHGQELVVHRMNLLVLQTTFFEIRRCKVEQRIATQNSADCSLEDVGDFIVKDFRSVCILKWRKPLITTRRKFITIENKTQFAKVFRSV